MFMCRIREFNPYGGIAMTWIIVESAWIDARGRIKQQWSMLTDEDLDAIAGRRDALLTKVQEALHRMEVGTYGKCVVCGREIEVARLEAIPWASYCMKDQEKEEQRP